MQAGMPHGELISLRRCALTSRGRIPGTFRRLPDMIIVARRQLAQVAQAFPPSATTIGISTPTP